MNKQAIIKSATSILLTYAVLAFIANSLNPGEWKTWERVVLAVWSLLVIKNNKDQIQIL